MRNWILSTGFLASLLAGSVSAGDAGRLISEVFEGERVVSSRSTLGTESGKYEGFGIGKDIGGDGEFEAVVYADLRTVGNISLDPNTLLDNHSFDSIVKRWNFPYLVCLGSSEDSLRVFNGTVESSVREVVDSSDVVEGSLESRLDSVKWFNLSPLISSGEVPAENFYFRRATISSQKELPQLNLVQSKQLLPFGDRSPSSNESGRDSREKYISDNSLYRNFSVDSIFLPGNFNGGFSCAGLGVDFEGDGEYDVLAVIDLRDVVNSWGMLGSDVKSMAFWGDLSDEVYSTCDAAIKLGSSRFLRNRMNEYFPPRTGPQLVVGSEDSSLRSGYLKTFLDKKPRINVGASRKYFHAPEFCQVSELS